MSITSREMDKIITEQDCIKIIQKFLGSESVTVHTYDISAIDDDHPGYLGEYFRLRIQFDDVS